MTHLWGEKMSYVPDILKVSDSSEILSPFITLRFVGEVFPFLQNASVCGRCLVIGSVVFQQLIRRVCVCFLIRGSIGFCHHKLQVPVFMPCVYE